MMKSVFLAALVVLMTSGGFIGALASLSSVESCSVHPPQNICCFKTQLLFLLDRSMSTGGVDVTEQIKFMKRARCLFDESRTQAGLIIFNKDVKTVIPLKNYSSDEWYAKLEEATSIITPKSPYTPMAEAFWLAKRVLDGAEPFGSPCEKLNRLVIVMTDGGPYQNMPNKVTGGDLGVFKGWRSIRGTGTPTPKTSLMDDAAKYTEVIVPQQAQILKTTTNARIIMVAMPTPDELGPRTNYFKGVIDPRIACRATNPPSSGLPPTMGVCPTGGNSANTQCYQRRYVRFASLILQH